MVLAGIVRRLLPVHDISTDYRDVPQFLKGKQSKPQLVPLLKVFYADVKPIVVSSSAMTVPQVYQTCLDAAKAMPLWTIEAEQPADGILQALSTTKLLKFKDDVVVRVRQAEGRVVVDTRSRSRIGQGDLGANGNRILQYQAAVKALLPDHALGSS